MIEYKCCTTNIASGNALDELQVKTGRKIYLIVTNILYKKN